MFIVTDLNGNTEALTNIQGAEIYEEINDDFSLSFSTILSRNNEHSYPLLMEESIIEHDQHEYRVKQLVEVRNKKSIVAQHVFFDLIDCKKEDIFGGTKTANEMFGWILSNTVWTFEIVDYIPPQLFTNFGESNVLALIRAACKIFGCSIKIERNKHLKIGMRVGIDKDEQFRYKYNIKTLKKTVDTTKLTTCIKGIGGNGLEIIYKSPNVSIYGERWADDVTDERFTIAESLTEHIKSQLQDVPEISIDVEALTLGMDVKLDDGIWTIYEPMGIEYLSFVQAIKSYPLSNKSSVVTLSNMKQTLSDLLTQTKIEIDENKKETRSKIEQTNERITLEVERVDESIATIDLKADNISLSVQSLANDVDAAEARLDIQASQIESKVSQTDFNGNTINSIINQTATTIKLQANKIELAGVVTTNDIQIGNSLRLGNSDWSSSKSLVFNDSTYIVAVGDRLEFEAPTGGLNFLSYASFHNIVDASNATLRGIVGCSSSQNVRLDFNSNLTMTATVNGRTATFMPV